MSNHEELVGQFRDVTDAASDRATFYLESSNWDLQIAIASFFENEQAGGSDEDNTNQPDAGATGGSREEGTVKMAEKPKSKPKAKSGSRVVTLHNMDKSSSSDDEETGQAFYAGGSTHSGQQVLGPPRSNPNRDFVSEVFRSAQESGAEVLEPNAGSSAGGGSGSSFMGTAYRLGQTSDDHVALPGMSRQNRAESAEPVVLKLWRMGFSINDGDLRRYDEADNKEFLESIMKGEIPHELRRTGQMVNVNLEDHRHEEFTKPASKLRPFTGKGHTLGNPAPNVVESQPSVAAAAPAPTIGADNTANESSANAQINLDTNAPTTTVQVRLADGTRISTRFNLTHTVSNIRSFITTARPQYAASEFNLLTTFPSKELTDDTQTIQQAGLANAAILQRLK